MLGLRSHTQGFQRLASPPLCGLQAAALALTWVIPAPALSFFLFIPTGPNIGVSEGIRTLLLTGPGALSAPAMEEALPGLLSSRWRMERSTFLRP